MLQENNLQKALKNRLLSPAGKGLGDVTTQPLVADAGLLGWNLLREDVSLPVAVLSESRVQHNLQWMKSFISTYGLKLAPHGKTTMSPALFHRQLEEGAWGITLATAPQVQAAYEFGVRRVLMANQLVGKANMAIISRLLEKPGFEFYVIVDSAANVAQLGDFFAAAGQRLNLLLELGVTGGRTGVRDVATRDEVLAAIARFPRSLALCGVEVYEGVLKEEPPIREFLRLAVRELLTLEANSQLQGERIILTGAGSAWFDLVAEEWTGLARGWNNDHPARPLDIVLRPGCYLTHDVGIYKAAETRIHTSNLVARDMQTSLLPALQLWAYVLSIPEPGLAILGLGKRDAAFDAGLPVPAQHYRPGRDTAPSAAPAEWKLTAMMDQHAFMQIAAGDDLAVGDMLVLDISHPCLTFDKWRQLLVVNDNYAVVDAVETFF
ncbi:amino acid deaminase [Cellvibrio mixtus]|uniref:amino acid deaminase n=1 Tax=Cellvibrio mixtus TaxID=39650 RepID=UPI000587C11D|nr:amino acid deaminase [Cellvibrio mixtus]